MFDQPGAGVMALRFEALIQCGKRVLTGLGVVAAFAVIGAGVGLAPERAREQNAAAKIRDLTTSFIAHEAMLDGENSVALPSFAALSVFADSKREGGFITHNISGDHSLGLSHLDTIRAASRERRCLAEAIYYEARSEMLAGQMAVAEVVLNRVRHRAYPDSVCGVVYEGAERTTGCQFTFTCDGSTAHPPTGRSWERAQSIADHVLMGFAPLITNRATHYHTTAVDPIWNDSLVRTRRIGAHIFYRFPNRPERHLLAEREA